MKIMKKLLLWVLTLAMVLPLCTVFAVADTTTVTEAQTTNKALAYRRPSHGKTASTSITLTSDLPKFTNEVRFSVKLDELSKKGFVVDFKSNGTLISRLNFADPTKTSSDEQYVGKMMVYDYNTKQTELIAPSYEKTLVPIMTVNPSKWINVWLKWTEGSDKASLYIDKKLVSENIVASASLTAIDQISILSMTSWESGGVAFIDNIELYGDGSSTPYYANDFENETVGSVAAGWATGTPSILVEATTDAPKPHKNFIPNEDFEDMETSDLAEPDWMGVNKSTSANGGEIALAPDGLKMVEKAEHPEMTKAFGSVLDGNVDSGVLNIDNAPAVTKEVSFDLYAENCSNAGFYLDFRNKTGDTITSSFGLDFQLPSATADGKYSSYGKSLVASYSGSGVQGPSFNAAYPAIPNTSMKNGAYMQLGEWHNIKVILTEGASTAELYIDNYKVADIPADASVKSINNIWIQKMAGTDDGANYIFVDNLKLVGADSDEPYYFEDFEDYKLGRYSGSLWTKYKSSDSALSVVEVPVPNKTVVFRRPSDGINSYIDIKENLPSFTSEVSFAIKLESTSLKGFGIDFMGNGNFKTRLNFADPSLASDKEEYVGKQIVHYYDPTNKVAIEPAYYSNGTTRDARIVPITTLDPGKWYTFTLKFTEGSDRASLYIDGVLVCETVYDNSPSDKVINKIVIQHMTGNKGESAYIDNIALYGEDTTKPYYENDFENETVGENASSMTHTGKLPMYIVADTPVQKPARYVTVESTKAYKVYQNGGGQTMTYRNFIETDNMSVSFDWLATKLSNKSGAYISLSNGEKNWIYSVRAYYISENDTYPTLVDGKGNRLATIELGVWYNMKMEYANDIVKFYIDGEYIADIAAGKNGFDSVSSIFFGTTSSSTAYDTYYIDNLKFTNAEGFYMNDTPNEFTDNFNADSSDYTFSSDSYAISGGKLTLNGEITATRAIDATKSGKFGFNFNADKLEGITITLLQKDCEAVSVKFEEDGTILCRRDIDWIEISNSGKLKAGENVDFSLDLAPERNVNYFTVRVNGKITATALYQNYFGYIDGIKISVPEGTKLDVDSLYALDSEGIIKMPEREESSPEIYLPMVIEGAKPMFLAGDSTPLTSSLEYATGTDKLVLDSKNTSIGIDLGSVQTVNAIRITGVAEIQRPVKFNQYTVYQSDDNQNWIKVKGFSYNHYTENGVSVGLFEVTGVEARYLKVTSVASTGLFEVGNPLTSIRAEARIARQWKMAGNAMYALGDTDPVYTPMTRELYDKAITVKNGDSVGINFGLNSHVEAIELVGSGLSTLDASAFELYQSSDNAKYTLIENVTLSRDVRDGKDVYRLTFKDTVCGYLKLHAVTDMTVELADLYDGLCAYSSVEVDSGNLYYWTPNRGGEGDFFTMPDGTLVMVYTGYPINGEVTDYSDNVLKATSSTDGGYTWSTPWITLRKQDQNTNLMCASYHYMANGDLAIIYIEKLPDKNAHVLIRRSQDYGRSWSEPICITEEPLGYSILSSAVNGLHLSDGRFVVAINYNYSSSDCHGSDRAVSYMAYSDDDGYTWNMSASTITLPNSSVEPVIAELPDGDLIMTMRTRKENSIYQTISTDRGITWAQSERVENINTPSSTNSVHTLPATGDLLMVWNNEIYDANSNDSGNGNRDPLCYAISTDKGLTYKNLRNIVEAGASWACLRFYGRAVVMCYSAGTSMKVTDIAELYYTREGNKTVADLPVAATPNATYANGWLNGVTSTMMYSLDGGSTWSFCGGTSVQIGEFNGDILVKDIGTAATAPSGVQTIGTTVVLASDLGIVPGDVTEVQLNTLIKMASEGGYTFKFDSGVYVFPKTIELPSNVAIVGDADTVFMLNKGASGKAASPAVISIGKQIDNVRISNLTVKGYNNTVFCPTYAANNIGIKIHNALRVNIDHVNVEGFADSGIKATTMGLIFWDDNLSYDERQAYFKGLQLSDCRIEKCYYGLNLSDRAEYCQITNLAAGYNNIGCVNSGGNNSFVNCLFNKNNTGFYLLCTNKPNPGHGGATGCSFNHNQKYALIVEDNQIGFSFTGCQFFDQKIVQTNSYGTVFSACILGSVTLEASGAKGANLFAGCFFQTDRNTILAGNDGTFTVTDCIDVPATAVTLASESTAEPQMTLLSATSKAPRIYSGATTLMASDFGVTTGNVSEKALDALIAKANEGGYTFKFDSGVYVFPKTIVLPSDTAIIGDAGTVFMLSQSASGKSATPAVISIGSLVDNVRISNLTIKGYNDTAYPSYKANTSGIKINSALKVSIDNVTVMGFAESGIKATNMGCNYWTNSLTDDQKQAYFKGLQLTDCRLEKNYIGLELGARAEYCQITNLAAGFNNIGCVNSGGNNSFVNCVFNNNNVGFSLDCANKSNPGHGGASGCTFANNNDKAIAISGNRVGYTFNGCNIQGKITSDNSVGTILNACLIDGSLEASGEAGSGIIYGSRIKNDSSLTSGSNGVFAVADCIVYDGSANIAQTTYNITSNSPAAGGTVEVSSLGILPGVVSNEALDALVAFAQNGGYTLKFDSGVYEFQKSFAIPSNTTVVGCANTVFKLTGANVGKVPVISVTGVENIRLYGFIVLGELTKNFIKDKVYSSAGSVGILVNEALRVNLENITVKNFNEVAVKIDNVGLSGYTETVQISDCRFENSYYGLWLTETANFCQVTGSVMGYCASGCLDSGANNSFANCAFNKNRVGFYVYHTNFAGAGAGTIVNSCFNHNDTYSIRIDNCTSGYIFSGCQIFGNVFHKESSNIIISSTILGSATIIAQNSAANSCKLVGCFFQTDKAAILENNQKVYTVVDCVEVPTAN